MTTPLLRISELEAQLKEFREKHGDLRVVAMWEDSFQPIQLFRSAPGLGEKRTDYIGGCEGPAVEESDTVTWDETLLILHVEAGDFPPHSIYRPWREHPEDR